MSLLVERVGGLVTVQDRGRAGLAHLGVPRAGALDPHAADLANRLVGNDADAAVLEVTLGGLTLTTDTAPDAGCWVAVTGAPCAITVDGRARGHREPVRLAAGARLDLGPATTGVRSYLAVSGGVDVDPVLGSRSTDTLAWVGPPRVVDGTRLPVGAPTGSPAPVDTIPEPRTGPLRLHLGPRADWLTGDVLAHLCRTSYAVSTESNRIGLRLDGTPLVRARTGELASEGLVLGAVQVPPDGRPVVFLADHPTTGGYPVVAVVEADDLARCAWLRPGDAVRFTRA